MMQIQKVTLIGLGAMGAFFAPRLSAKLGAGFRVMADGARKDRLEQRGVTVNGTNYRFPIITPDQKGDPADLVIVAVKGYDLDKAIEDIQNQVAGHTLILTVLNGVESEKKAAAAYGASHILYSYMRISVVMRDGKTEFDPRKGSIHFGEGENDPEHLSERVLAVKGLFDACEIDYKIDSDMIRGLWFKFMCNVGENMTCALFGIPFGAFQKNEDANYFRRAAMWEVIHIANRLGIGIGQEDIDRQEHTLGRIPYENKPSTLQDLEIGKPTETDMFAGTVVRLGKELGVETPVCEMMYRGIKILEAKNAGLI